MVGSGAKRRGEAKRRRRPATCALYLVLFPRFNRGRAHAVGRVGVVAKRRLGVERNGNETLSRISGGGSGISAIRDATSCRGVTFYNSFLIIDVHDPFLFINIKKIERRDIFNPFFHSSRIAYQVMVAVVSPEFPVITVTISPSAAAEFFAFIWVSLQLVMAVETIWFPP